MATLRFFAALLFLFTCADVVHAQSDMERTEQEEDFDYSWLDPDKKIYVLQNRKYTKNRKLELSIAGGMNLSGPYTSSNAVIGRASYYFTEQFGASFIGTYQSNTYNETFEELKKTSSVFPNIRDVKSFFGGSFLWIPFYGKLNIFNQIIYIDWMWEFGVASVASRVNANFTRGAPDLFQDTNHTGVFWGSGLKFFLNRTFALRLDFLALYYSAPILRQGVITSESSTNDNYYLTLGLGVHF